MVGESTQVVLIGAGRMGQAMLVGWLRALADSHTFHVIDPQAADAVAALAQDKENLNHYASADHLPEGLVADVIVLATKPQIVSTALQALPVNCLANAVVVSVAAGIEIADIRKHLSGNTPVARVMPNIGAQVGYCVSAGFSPDDTPQMSRAHVEMLFDAIGSFCWLGAEEQIHAVTAVSGSGPAYLFAMCEAMIAAGTKHGLDADTARSLAIRTVSAAGRLLEQTPDPAHLRETVTSPNGTTAAGLAELFKENSLECLLTLAVASARRRSIELSSRSTKP